jgi:hypothetical protein
MYISQLFDELNGLDSEFKLSTPKSITWCGVPRTSKRAKQCINKVQESAFGPTPN